MQFSNAVYCFPLAEQLGISPNYLQSSPNLAQALTYLVHFGYPNKTQYEQSEVSGPLANRLGKYLITEDEGERVLQIVEMIDSSPSPTYREILIKACKAGLYSEFRRLGYGVKMLLEEHYAENK